MKTARMSAFTSVIVTYNSQGEVGDLLGDLGRHAPGSPVVVVDNDSQDGSVALIAGGFPQVHLLRNRQNLGYSRAANQGAASCTTPYILLLNPDIRILDPAVFTELLACMDSQPEVAAAAPLQFQEDEQGRRLTFTWSYLSWESFRFYWQQRLHHLPSDRAPMPVPFLNAGCLMLRRSAFEQVGRLCVDALTGVLLPESRSEANPGRN